MSRRTTVRSASGRALVVLVPILGLIAWGDIARVGQEAAAAGAKSGGASRPRYKSPHSAAFTPDGRFVCVTLSGADALAIVDAKSRKVVAEIPVGREPHGVAVSADGSRAYVVHHAGHTLGVVDLARRQMIAEHPVGWYPEDVALEPAGKTAWVTNHHQASVSQLNLADGRELRRVATVARPIRSVLTPDGRFLLVTCDNSAAGFDESRCVCVIDTATGGVAVSKLDMATNVRGLAVSPDGRFALAVHLRAKIRLPAVIVDDGFVVTDAVSVIPLELPKPPEQGAPVRPPAKTKVRTGKRGPADHTRLAELTAPPPAPDPATARASVSPPPAPLDPDAPPALSALAELDTKSAVLDERSRFWADPHDVKITPDGRFALVTSAGSHGVLVLDLNKLDGVLNDPARKLAVAPPTGTRYYADVRDSVLAATPGSVVSKITPGMSMHIEAAKVYGANDNLAESDRFTTMRIGGIPSPRYSALSPDGKELWCCGTLDDSLSVVMLAAGRSVRLNLNPAIKTPDLARRGEQIFNDANRSRKSAFSCASCHPGGGDDGSVWNLAAERGGGTLSTKSLLGCSPAGPFGWMGERGTLSERVEETFHHTMSRRPDAAETAAVVAYIGTTKTLAHPEADRLRTEAATARGEAIFRGKGQCSKCHNGPDLSSGEIRDIGTGGKYKVPSLRGVWATAPYLHHAAAKTLPEIWQNANNPQGNHGAGAKLTADETRDLVQFLKTL